MSRAPLSAPEEDPPNRTHDIPENKREEILAELISGMEENLKAVRAVGRNALNTGTEFETQAVGLRVVLRKAKDQLVIFGKKAQMLRSP